MLYVSFFFLTLRTLSSSLAEALAKYPEEEEGVAEQVAAPQAAGVEGKARQPLEAVIREDARSAA